MKALIVLHDFRGGGAERVAVKLANQLAIENEVTVAFSSNEGPCIRLLSTNIRLIDMQSSRVLFSVKKLSKILKDNDFDIVISHLTHVNISAILACLITKKINKLVVVEHSQMLQNYKKQKSKLMRLVYLSTKFFYKYPKAVVGVSDGLCDSISSFTKLERNRCATIYNPIISSSHDQREKIVPEHKFFKEKEKNNCKAIFIYVGRLIYSKRVDLILDAFLIVKRSLDARLIIVGDGELRSSLEHKTRKLNLSDSVSFTGFVDNVDCYLKYSNTLVMASEWEGLPSVLIEALAAGIQCVSTDCPSGPREILLNGKLGFLCPMFDSNALAISMIKSINNPITIINPKLERFEMKHVAKKYLDLVN